MQRTGLTLPKALKRLNPKAHDSVREAIGDDIEPRLRSVLRAEGVSIKG